MKKIQKTYLIQDLQTGYLKIGKGVDPQKRIKALQTGSGGLLKLISVLPSDRQKELHQRFKHLRIRHNSQFFYNDLTIINFFQNPVDFYQDNNIKKY